MPGGEYSVNGSGQLGENAVSWMIWEDRNRTTQAARGRGIQIPFPMNVLAPLAVTLFYAVCTEISIMTYRPFNAANNFFPTVPQK